MSAHRPSPRHALGALGAVVAALVASSAACAGTGAQPPPHSVMGQGGSRVRIEIALPKLEFVMGERIDVDVYVHNAGPAPVQVPLPADQANEQPAYTLTGPAYPQGVTFSHRSVAMRDPRRAGGSVPPALAMLEPGQSFEHGFDLGKWTTLDQPGTYTLQAHLRSNGIDAASERVTFQLLDNRFLEAALAADVSERESRLLRAAWLGEGSGGRAIGIALIYAKRPDLGEFQHRGPISMRRVGAQASEPMLPWTNYDRAETTAFWLAWREGDQLLAWPGTDAPPASRSLGGSGAQPVHPALQSRSGALEVFLLARAGQAVGLARFAPPGPDGVAPAPSLVDSVVLPVPALAARATLAPESLGSAARVALLGARGNGILLMDWSVGGTVGAPLRSVDVPDVRPLAGSELAVHVDLAGRMRISVVVAGATPEDGLAVVDVLFPADRGAPAEARVTPLPALGSPPVAAAVAFDLTPAADASRAWLVQLESGEVVHSARPNTPQRVADPLARPLQFFRLFGGPYVLAVRASAGPRLVALE